MAISAEFCCAFDAIALIKVNTKLRLAPPNITIPVKRNVLLTGLVRNIKKSKRLRTLINIMSITLYKSLLMIKSTGDATE